MGEGKEKMNIHNMEIELQIKIDNERFNCNRKAEYPNYYTHSEIIERLIEYLKSDAKEFISKLDEKQHYRPSQIEQVIEDFCKYKQKRIDMDVKM